MTLSPSHGFGLLRHAQTPWNAARRIQGWVDTPLSLKGVRQAQRMGYALQGMGLTRILCSDLARARETAHLLNEPLQLPIIEAAGLREQNWGEWTGRSLSQLRETSPREIELQEQAGWRFRPPLGESRKEVLERACKVLHQSVLEGSDGWTLVITHLGVIKCLVNWLAGSRFLSDEPDPVDRHSLQLIGCSNGLPGIFALNLQVEAA